MIIIKKIINNIYILITILNFNLIFSISLQEAEKIGNLIWMNEASKREDLLVFWNQHEAFPSLGIGHFIWFLEDQKMAYQQQFPELCSYLQKNGIKLPDWLKKALKKGAPWDNREDFLKDKIKTEELRHLLASTVPLQTKFIIKKFDEHLPIIIKAVPNERKSEIKRYLDLLHNSFLGIYSLVDYLNFKGSGLTKNGEFNPRGWGLTQVLLGISGTINKDNVNKAFAASASQVLLNLIHRSAPEYKSIVFLDGWMKRISTYANTKNL